MTKDLKKYKHLAFLGVSHKKLHNYLKDTIKSNQGKTLPWESIMIFYASPKLGRIWEQESFESNIKESKIEIVNVLFSQDYRKLMPNLKTIQFRQCNSTYNLSFSGCFCGNEICDTTDFRLQVIYAVNHLPIDSQTEKSWTIRLERKNKSKEYPLFERFEESFIKIKNGADAICDIEFSLWEWSAKEWNNFVEKYTDFFTEGIDKMINGLDINNKQILDVGSGTGNVANYLIKKFPQVKFTLVDASANMLKVAKDTLGDKAIYELFNFPLNTGYFENNNGNRYDYIISHLSIQSMTNNIDEISSFVLNCNALLKSKGCVLLAIHNSCDIQLEQENNQVDEFRIGLINEIKRNNFPLKEISPAHFKIKIEDIRNAFTKKYFKEIYFDEFELRFTMHDRVRLWKIPAVLDSLVNVEKIGIAKGKEMVQKVYEENKNFQTPNRRMIVFHFQKI